MKSSGDQKRSHVKRIDSDYADITLRSAILDLYQHYVVDSLGSTGPWALGSNSKKKKTTFS